MALTNFELRSRIAVDGFLGYVQGISLPTVLQMVEMEKTTCTVCVYGDLGSGRLHFRQGKMIDAEAGPLVGEIAALEIVNWTSHDIEIRQEVGQRPVRIATSLAALLLEASRLHDEQRRPVEDRQLSTREIPLHDEPIQWKSVLNDAASQEMGMNTLHKVLESFRQEVPEFVSTDIVNVDSGLSIGGGSIDPDFDGSIAAASYAEVVKANGRALELLGLGATSTEDILISTQKVYVLIRPMGAEYYHVLAVGRKGNLGLARAIMKKYEPKLLTAIGELS